LLDPIDEELRCISVRQITKQEVDSFISSWHALILQEQERQAGAGR